jgi:hypothetical protein
MNARRFAVLTMASVLLGWTWPLAPASKWAEFPTGTIGVRRRLLLLSLRLRSSFDFARFARSAQ